MFFDLLLDGKDVIDFEPLSDYLHREGWDQIV
uniref:NADH-plastoquinone oxidoreductase subunit 7 n=1 Tax=Picea brachytyla var. complanata TaxID=1043705 RepID=A0A8K1WA16_9CONI|nr:NADH-plastoquinone oxidoreductase subunit 7 [Picea brachytyla var. complanata]